MVSSFFNSLWQCFVLGKIVQYLNCGYPIEKITKTHNPEVSVAPIGVLILCTE